MKTEIGASLPSGIAPASWATRGGDTVYFTTIPVRSDNSIDTGDIASQTKRAMDRIVEAAGGTMDDITQLQVHLSNEEDKAGMTEVYKTYFKAPYSNRATLLTENIHEGVRIEIVGYAYIPQTAA